MPNPSGGQANWCVDLLPTRRQQSATVDRFLDDLDAMAPSEADVQYPVATKMRSASRVALTSLLKQFDEIAEDLDDKGLSTLADDLTSVAAMLIRETVVTRYLTLPAEDASPRVRLIERLVSDKVGQPALDVLKRAVSERWSADSDLIDAVELVARQALLTRAERAGQLDEVEDQLFRFSRILDAQPRLVILLGDYEAPADARIQVAAQRAWEVQAPMSIRSRLNCFPRRSSCCEDNGSRRRCEGLAEVAVARRGEVVAHVSAAAELSDAQQTRLTEVLSRIYGHPVTAQMQIDPESLGGLAISVGDEVIDGTLSSRLAAAQTHLPD